MLILFKQKFLMDEEKLIVCFINIKLFRTTMFLMLEEIR